MKTFQERIIILDFGAQYSQLIARRVREAGVYSEIYPFNIELEKLADLKPKGIILSGGPSSVYAEDAPHCDRRIFELDVPILGICYGLQLMAYFFNGQVDSAAKREFGRSEITINNSSDLFADLDTNLTVWMSHGDKLDKLPDDFESIAHTDNAPVAAARHKNQPWYGVQFHPEVAHTPRGFDILKNFVFQICRCEGGWNASSFVESTVENVQQQVGDGKVVCGLSGGVDSSVAAVLIHKAIGEHLTCIFVDNGLLRKGEVEQVVNTFQNHFHIPLIHVDASKQFLSALRGVIDPEEKRKIIGKVFIDVFESEAKKIEDAKFLAQGTLYPDLIESVSFKGPSATIKSHHNVGGLPEKMNLELVEPLRELFKDEVRKVGHELEIPSEVLNRHPFPGPGLAIRIMGDVTEDKLAILRETDAIFIEELRSQNLYDSVWQALTVLLPVQTVGVMGDERTYENVVALRDVTSLDGMTADWAHLPHEFLSYVSNRIINEIRGINRVVYDISSKPPSTIEWE